MERRGFLGRLFGGVLVAAGLAKAAPSERVLFKGVELIPDDECAPRYSFVQVHGIPKGHDKHMMDLITDKMREGQRAMKDLADKELFRDA